MFCHHHRPAIRIPSLPLLNLRPSPSAEQQAYGQQQTNEWTRLLQQQYNIHYHSHAVRTSTISSLGHGQNKGSSEIGGNHHATQQQQHLFLLTERQPYPLSSQFPHVTCLQEAAPSQHDQHKPIDRACQGRTSLFGASPEIDPSLSSALASLSLSKHYAASLIAQCELDDCEQPCIVRKNKVLPPPTLSPILSPTISNPASLSPTTPVPSTATSSSGNRPLEIPVGSSPTSSSNNPSDDDGKSEPISQAWPAMDKFFFPDHCCRTSPCRPSARLSKAGNGSSSSSSSAGNGYSNGKKNGGGKAKSKKAFVSELPPPPPSPRAQRDSNGCIALSASIWGTGWHQVEPLPESFVKTIQKSNLLWAGCEREHQSYPAKHHHRNRRDTGQSQGSNQGQPNKNASSNASSSPIWTTTCSSRLPRSLQFID